MPSSILAPTPRRVVQTPRSAVVAALSLALAAAACTPAIDAQPPLDRAHASQTKNARIVLLHHSVGEVIWNGGLANYISDWNSAHGSRYEITELTYPNTLGGHADLRRVMPGRLFVKLVPDRYPWDNYPYDYWNLWIAHKGNQHDRYELNLDDLVRSYDVIVFKHCYPVSGIEPDNGVPSVSSPVKTEANYRLQYEALKQRMHEFPQTKFILWTPTGLTQAFTNPTQAERADRFTAWVKDSWDTKGDNIFLWDFRKLQTGGDLYVQAAHARKGDEAHPSDEFAAQVAPLLGRRIVDVIEGRGDTGSLTGGSPARGDQMVRGGSRPRT
ncbi:MAG: hypothetical protein LKCHEGNO_00092 [Burkholderiaceae bacterium]|nr:hypothetical protein [Burkholderiaceae bacterium]